MFNVVNYPEPLPHQKLLVSKSSNIGRQLRPFVFFPNHHWDVDPYPFDFPPARKGEVKLPDECNQEHV